MPAPPLTHLAGLPLSEIARLADAERLPPVANWHPAGCGHSGMRIAADGTWWHEGAPIARPELVRLFATILRREADGRHVLVTPAERLDIDVDEAAFVAVEVASEGAGRNRRLAFRLNTGAPVIAGPGHGWRVEARGDGPRLFLHVRDRLEALVARPVWYELAEWALADGGDPPGLWSGGAWLPLSA